MDVRDDHIHSVEEDTTLRCIVETIEHRRDLVRQIHDLFGIRGFSMDAFVLSPEELQEQKDVRGKHTRIRRCPGREGAL